MKITLLQGASRQHEFGYPRQADVTYQVLVSESEARGLSPLALQHVIASHRTFSSYVNVRSVLVGKVEGGYRYEVHCTALNKAYRTDVFVFHARAGLSSKQSGADIFGNANTVQYPAGATGSNVLRDVALVDVPVPQYELVGSGVVDIARLRSPERPNPIIALEEAWIGKVNSTLWQGVAPRKALCASVDAKPVYLSDSQDVYLITFTMLANPDGHDPWIYFVGDDGRIPADSGYQMGSPLDYRASYRQTLQYAEQDFNMLFPLGDET